MKKNKALTAAISVLSLTMVSMCAIGGTFAKYASQGSATDTATVAKWGINLSVTGQDATLKDDIDSDGQVSAKVEAEGLAAPGTSQELAKVALTGTPEVAYSIEVTVNLELGDNWKLEDSKFYCPLVFTVGGTPIKMGGEIDTADELEDAVEKAIIIAITGGDGSSNTKTYNAGVAVPDTANSVLIDWKWDFGDNETTNPKDTYLGQQGNATVAFSLTVDVEQVD